MPASLTEGYIPFYKYILLVFIITIFVIVFTNNKQLYYEILNTRLILIDKAELNLTITLYSVDR